MGARLASRVGAAGVRKRFKKSEKQESCCFIMGLQQGQETNISEMDTCNFAKCKLISFGVGM